MSYNINWPSGLSLGEGRLEARQSKAADPASDRWHFELALEAILPGFAVKDRFHSTSSREMCSLEFEKETAHGKRKAREKLTFNRGEGLATRATIGGGKTLLSIPDCAKDALAFLFHTRRELAQGRVPPGQTIFFGGPYSIRLEYSGPQSVTVNEKRIEVDRVLASVRGTSSDISFELFFARDAARTPVAVRVPFSMGTFSMELAR